ncbi:MAG: TetR/AcrR family transcriptional regulator [Candidatus Eremiobacteraeota bacterium]|nr:TetR/AcrR family transcriptional regulator [Candidatus Eremiobacteraeota bacterium]
MPRTATPAASTPRVILDVAFAHLVERGFEGLRIRDLAEAAGINQATLLYHFSDKEELIVALIGDIIEKLRARSDAGACTFDEHLHGIADRFTSSPEMYVALTEISARATRHPRIAQTFASYQQGWRERLKAMLRAQAPHAKPAALESAAWVTQTFVQGLANTASGSGSLAALLAGGKRANEAARRIHAEVDTFCAMMRAGLRARGTS